MTGFVLPGFTPLTDLPDAARASRITIRPPADPPDEAQAIATAYTPEEERQEAEFVASLLTAPGNVSEDAIPPSVCDTCSAARLAEGGVMPTSVSADELHSRCRQPGSCTCGCNYSRGGRCSNCGRNQPFDALQSADGDRVECVDRAACAKAMLDRPAPVVTANGSKKPTSARKEGTKTPSTPRPVRPKAEARQCLDGCGETTGGGTYKPGHDSRHVKALVAAVRAGGLTQGAALEQLPSEALRAKLAKQLGG